MKMIKIKKSWYTDFEKMYIEIDACHDGYALYDCVFWSAPDFKKSRRELNREVKKQQRWMSKKHLELAVGMHMLNYSPSEIHGQGLKPGYMIVDTKKIEEKKNGKTKD